MLLGLLLDAPRLHRRPATLWRLAQRLAPVAVALLLTLGLAAGLAAPWLEAEGNARLWTFAYIPVLALVMLGLLGWLALFTASSRRAGRAAVARRRRDARAETLRDRP